MAGAVIIGSVGVSVTPDARGFGDKLKAALQPAADLVGRQVGQAIGNRITDAMPAAGEKSGTRFSDTFKARVDAALAKLPDAAVHLDDADAERTLAQLRADLHNLSANRIGVDIDSTLAMTRLREVQVKLDELGARSPKIDVKVDILRASAELATLQAEVDKLSGKGGGDEGGFAGLAASMGESASGFSALIPLGLTAFAVLIPIVAVLTGGVLAFVGALGAAALGVGALAAIALPTIKAIKDGVGPAGQALQALKSGFDGIVAALKPQVLSLVTSFLQIAATFLPIVAQFAQSAATGFQRLVTTSGPFVSQIKGIASGFAALSGPAIVGFGQLFEALAVAGGKLLLAFTPLALQILPKITAAINNFSSGDGISRFLNFVTTNGPLVVGVLGDIARIVGQMVTIFAPLGVAILAVTKPILDFVAAHPEIALGIVAGAITGVAIALIILTESNPIALLATGIILGLALLIANWNTVKAFVEQWGPQLLIAIAPMIGIPLVIYQHFSQIEGFLRSAFAAALGAVTGGVNAIVSFVAGLPGRLLAALASLGGLLAGAASAAWGAFLAVTTYIAGAIVGYALGIPGRIVGALGSLAGLLGEAASAAWGGFLATTEYVAGAIIWYVAGLPGRIGGALGSLAGALSRIGSAAIGSLGSGISGGVGAVLSYVGGLPGRIAGALGNLASLLYNAGRNVISGLISGIESKIPSIGGVMGDIAGKIKGFLPFSPAKEGPLSGAGAPINSGISIGRQLAAGILSQRGPVASAIAAVAGGVSGTSISGLSDLNSTVSLSAQASLAGLSVAPLSLPAGSIQGGDSTLVELKALREEVRGLHSLAPEFADASVSGYAAAGKAHAREMAQIDRANR